MKLATQMEVRLQVVRKIIRRKFNCNKWNNHLSDQPVPRVPYLIILLLPDNR